MSKFIWKAIVTCGGLGLLPKAPGTWGSLGGLGFWVLCFYYFHISVVLALLLAIGILGIWATKKYSEDRADKDASEIVIDEWVGVGIALLGAELVGWQVAVAFILFRFFDITKLPGVRYFDRRHDALGVMMDDVVAGVYAAIVLGGLNVLIDKFV